MSFLQRLAMQSFSTLAANGSTATFAVDSLVNEVTVYLGTGATFGSGTLVLQASPDGGTTWMNVPNFSWTAGTANFQLGRFIAYGSLFRFTLSGATSPVLDVRCSVKEVRRGVTQGFSLTANGSTPSFTLNGFSQLPVTTIEGVSAVSVPWFATGSFGSGTLVLQVSPDGGTTWFTVQAGLTAAGLQVANPVTDALARFTLTGATSPSISILLLNA